MEIKVLGPGCQKCNALEKEISNALAELNIAADVEKVEDMEKIMKYDVLMTPALVINETVKVSGKVPKREEIKKWLQEEK